MSHSTSETVECPLCGERFDPTAAGGWCTNSDCGEWQHDAAAEGIEQTNDAGGTDDEAGPAPDESLDTDDSAPGSGTDDATGADGGPTGGTADDSAESGAADAAAAGSAGPEPTEDDEPAEADADDGSDEAELFCPSCGEAVAAEHNFCANCGEDISALQPGPLTECPACEADVEPEDNFCASCGEDLDAHRSGGDAATDDGAATDSESTPDRSVEQAAEAATADDSAEDTAEEDVAVGDAADDGPESLVLVVRNREVQVWDGDTVGRTIRSIVMNTGGDEDDAVRIHREHVKFVREDGQFHLVALGQNPTVVNGESLDEGDTVPVSPGDRIELSGVARMRVEAP